MARLPSIVQQGAIGTRNPNAPAGLNTGPGIAQQVGKGPVLGREQFATRQQNAIQARANRAFRQAAAADDAGCVVIPNISFTANVTQVLAHNLGVAWTSYRIENMQTTFARFFAAHVSAAQDAASISVTADANCIADVRVWAA